MVWNKQITHRIWPLERQFMNSTPLPISGIDVTLICSAVLGREATGRRMVRKGK